MKNIIIVGPGRNGKTTLAKKIGEELNCFVIHLDKLMTVFDRAYPQLDVRIAWDYGKATANVAPFLGHFLGLFSSCHGMADDLNLRKHAVQGNRFVLEGGHFDFEQISPILETYGIEELKDRFVLIGLVQNKKTVEEFLSDLRRYDTEDEWTYGMDDNELRELIRQDFIPSNQSMTDHLVKHGFTIYDTSTEREQVFEKIIADIKSKVENVECEEIGMETSQQVDLMIPVQPKRVANTKHPQETIIDTYNYSGIAVELVEWGDTIWCGKIGYALNTTDEPNVDSILSGFMALDARTMNERIESDWDVCMSVNYLAKERPNGVMFADLVGTEDQPEGFDVYKLPAGQYLRIAITDESARALGAEPWKGGIPPYEWIGEQLAPQLGYQYGDDRLPIFEYYGYYKPEKNAHAFRYLYVPVEKKKGE